MVTSLMDYGNCEHVVMQGSCVWVCVCVCVCCAAGVGEFPSALVPVKRIHTLGAAPARLPLGACLGACKHSLWFRLLWGTTSPPRHQGLRLAVSPGVSCRAGFVSGVPSSETCRASGVSPWGPGLAHSSPPRGSRRSHDPVWPAPARWRRCAVFPPV